MISIMADKEKDFTYINLDYWKDYITMHNVLACELSYSLIYNNIRPEKIKEALATVELDTLPNRFFLIQVDDYYNYSSKMQITQEFYQKTMLINLLRERIQELGLNGKYPSGNSVQSHWVQRRPFYSCIS